MKASASRQVEDEMEAMKNSTLCESPSMAPLATTIRRPNLQRDGETSSAGGAAGHPESRCISATRHVKVEQTRQHLQALRAD